ncbi:MAG: zinc-binding dehydrogenase [Anaerolineae bacterium]|nr:zinc-binding dehydrogenase [Anaerolineae bacterium]
MKAMSINQFGGPEVFGQIEVGQPYMAADEVLVKVKATSVNPIDCKLRHAGAQSGIELPAILGHDVSGIVENVGAAVHDFTIGEEVFYSPMLRSGKTGSYATYHVARAAIVARKPVNLSHEQAASIPLAGLTAWDALITKARVRAGESVLIHGAGGVGSLAIQLAKISGAYVIAVCSDYMTEMARALGADATVNYKSDDFTDTVNAQTDGYGVDIVVDTVGSDTLTRSIAVTKPFGRLAGIVNTDAGFREAFAKNITIYPTVMQRTRYKLDALRVLLERGVLHPVIDSVMALIQVAEAHRRLERGGVKGKLVLRVTE